MRVAIVGSRGYPNLDDVDDLVRRLAARRPDAVLVSGMCPRGPDKAAEIAAKKYGLEFDGIPADWSRGKQAGKERNWQLARTLSGKEDQLVAFWDGWSNGTAHVVTAATALGARAWVYAPRGLGAT